MRLGDIWIKVEKYSIGYYINKWFVGSIQITFSYLLVQRYKEVI